MYAHVKSTTILYTEEKQWQLKMYSILYCSVSLGSLKARECQKTVVVHRVDQKYESDLIYKK
jgi:hypothetical protein